MLNKAVFALVAGLAMACATAQAATVTTLALNYSPSTGSGVTNFSVLGIADYLSSTGREYVPISGSIGGGGLIIPSFFPSQTQAAYLATVNLPRPPLFGPGSVAAAFQPQLNIWETNVGGPPGVQIFSEANGGLTEDHFSLMLFVQCFNISCAAYPVRAPFSITFTTPDGVSIVATPIPAALPMFAAGLGLLWFGRRRTRRAGAGAARASAERR